MSQESNYIHGYSDQEQARLIQQAEYWKSQLILRDINYAPGESLLEIGCGAGAVLGILGTAFLGLNLAGIDLQAKQIDYARRHLHQLGLTEVDLRVGNASDLPWSDDSFDRLYAIWFLEHLHHPQSVLQEAQRVLKPGGTITLTETDYRGILVYPHSEAYSYLQSALAELLLQADGNPYQGQVLGNLLSDVGFKQVKNTPLAFHYSVSQNQQELQNFIDYVDSWLAPTIPLILEKLTKDRAQLQAGLDWFRNIPDCPDGAATAVIYRAVASTYPG